MNTHFCAYFAVARKNFYKEATLRALNYKSFQFRFNNFASTVTANC